MKTHGHAAGKNWSPTYMSWKAMHTRCKNPKCNDYDRYGGAGIAGCERWNQFENFLIDMGERPIGTVLDRIDGAMNYEPGNCRWVTWIESANNRRNTAFVIYNGQRLPAADVERLLGFGKGTVRKRAKMKDAATIQWGNSRPGNLNPASKFSPDTVREIRSMAGTDREIAKRFGVAKSTIYFIRVRKTYANIE